MKCPVCGEDDSDEFAYRVTFHYSSGTVKDKKKLPLSHHIRKDSKKDHYSFLCQWCGRGTCPKTANQI